LKHLGRVLVAGYDASFRAFLEEVEEAVGCMAVVAGEGVKRELAVPGGVSYYFEKKGRGVAWEKWCLVKGDTQKKGESRTRKTIEISYKKRTAYPASRKYSALVC
jgi:hypothetical protein